MRNRVTKTGSANHGAGRRARSGGSPKRGFGPSAERLEERQLLAVAIAEVALNPPALPRYATSEAIVSGPDGNLWLAQDDHSIGRLTPAGVYTDFPVTSDGSVGALAAGSDGNVWFIDNPTPPSVIHFAASAIPPILPNTVDVRIGRITPNGTITEFEVPGLSANTTADSIASGPDGNLWFTAGNQIDRITPAGIITSFSLPGGQNGHNIVSGPGGKLWFSVGSAQIGTITTGGDVTILPSVLNGIVMTPNGLTVGPDGSIWAITIPQPEQVVGPPIVVRGQPPAPVASVLDNVAPNGAVAGYGIAGSALSLTAGSDGNLWLTETQGDIVRFALTGATLGTTTTFALPTPGSNPGAITAGPDGNVWFVETYAQRVGQVELNAPQPGPLSATGNGTVQATAGTAFSGQLASFTPMNASDQGGDYVAQIRWGDGSTSMGTIGSDGQGGFVVDGDHRFANPGSFQASVTIFDVQIGNPGATASVSTTMNVSDVPLIPVSLGTVTGYRGQADPIVVAAATAPTTSATGTYTATIDWGDGSSSTGGEYFEQNSSTTLFVTGNHVYAKDGFYTVTTRITHLNGLTTTIQTTLDYLSPVIVSATGDTVRAQAGLPIGVQAPPITSISMPYQIEVARFDLSAPGISADGFSAVITWGDGSAPTQGVVEPLTPIGEGGGSLNRTMLIESSHVYTKPGTYHFYVTIITPGGTAATRVQGTAIISPVPVPFHAKLDPASDTGYSSGDGVTSVQQPRFAGTATPGTTVEIVARRPGSTTPISLGTTKVAANGIWAIRSITLPQGTYAVTANQINLDGSERYVLPVDGLGKGGTLVIDTAGPTVTKAVFNPATGQLVLDLADNLSRVNPLGLLARGAVTFSRVTAKGTTAIAVRVHSIKPGGGEVVLQLGQSVPNGRYVLQLAANSLRDAAGNALDGEFRTVLPSGNGKPGGNFTALFVDRGQAAVPAQPIV